MSVPNIEMFCANKMAHFKCCFEPIFQEPEHMHMDHFKCVKLLIYIYLKEGCKVLGPDFDTKWVIGAIAGVVNTNNKTPNLSSVFTCLYCTL